MLLAVDDVQWADESSVRWLVYMAARIGGLPLGRVVAARSTEPGRGADVTGELRRAPATLVIRPARLSAQATAARVREVLGSDADHAFCAACVNATGGNPFFVGELLGELGDANVAAIAANVHRVEAVTPEAVAHSVRARIARVSQAASSLARAVSSSERRSLCGARQLWRPLTATIRRGPLRSSRRLGFCVPVCRWILCIRC